ncbi:MAG: glutathione S-transferase, partial [Pseudomonadota bacterium]
EPRAPEAQLVSGYTGQSSVTTEGFDPCVVPTLIDHEKEQVIVDSAKICDYLDREAGVGERLVPDALSNIITEQIALIDQAPHVAVLYGAHPDQDVRPKGLATNIAGVHARKISALETMMAEVPDEAPLIKAYQSKITKESSASEFVYGAESMRAAHAAMADHVEALDQQLNTHNSDWVMGDSYTMADIMWTNSLYRLKWLGLGGHWETDNAKPRVIEYAERAFQRPSFQAAVIKWPGAYAPSPHVEEYAGPVAAVKFFWQLLRRGGGY